ncbi:cyanophycinase [Cytobacillus eiseniae]|uniref:Cyanophycinase n=1 Tax=Cytobacillus eiseniae TaxID=762947 RepID=A0ABS4RB13_9BACI|nr:Type 1 glutamine amidotransferase-like domain-containing protein [Cytobacillus eiseniae]MBP2239520.1 cyanophycinase [Cytobacillus eiseniae]
MNTHLFLFGGSPPFTKKMAKLFAEKVKGRGNPVSILIVNRVGWEEYMPKYTKEIEGYGIHHFHYLPLPTTSTEQVIQCIKNSSGIIIGGGNTNLYADYLVDTPISKTIKECFHSGVPVAGFSAGALISPSICVISPKDNKQNEFQFRQGLGLITDHLLAVHFMEWNDEEHLMKAVKRFSTSYNYGINEESCAYFLDGQLKATEGNGVYSFEQDLLVEIK